jgi:NAD(P)-dependent dehydrogenase (short-subunit alcohol dehydrogenase family)
VDELITAAVAELGGLDLLVLDGAGLFNDGDPGALGTCLHATWNVTRAVVNRAYLPADRAGRIVYLAPAPDAGIHADAARAGLENLARTLSIEWARYGITTVTIAAGAATTAGEVASLTAYLASPAGAYFSGCLFDLRGV